MPKSQSVSFETFLSKLGARDRANVEKHLAAMDAGPNRAVAKLWRQLAMTFCRLAPLPVRTMGQRVAQFYAPDGKYQMQVFTLEDNQDETLIVYLPDVLAEGVKAKVLGKPRIAKVAAGSTDGDEAGGVQPVDYPIVGSDGEMLRVEALTPTNTPDPPAHMKHMLGWNRKALRLTLPANGSGAQAAAAEALCTLAARAWSDASKAS